MEVCTHCTVRKYIHVGL